MREKVTAKLYTVIPFARTENGRISTVYDTTSGVNAMLRFPNCPGRRALAPGIDPGLLISACRQKLLGPDGHRRRESKNQNDQAD